MFSRLRFFFADMHFWISQRFGRRRDGSATESPAAIAEGEPTEAAAGEAKPSGPTKARRRSRPKFTRPSLPSVTRPTVPRPSHGAAIGFIVGALLAGIVAGGWIALDSNENGDSERSAPAPAVVIAEEEPESPPDLGFPEFATKNTTRISGSDAIADSVGAALAAFPSTGGVPGPDAVTMVAEGDWAAGIAASALVADPIRAPVLVGEGGEVPDLVLDALVALAPPGSSITEDTQLFRIGNVAIPSGVRAREIDPGTAAEMAAAIEELRRRLSGEDPARILLASSDEPAFAMPAAAWAARSGDPVLFVQSDSVPKATLELLQRYENAQVFLLGPESVVSKTVTDELGEAEIDVERVGGEDPVLNAIAFARYAGSSGFGWNITDPGHGLVLANAGRPADAAAAAILSASGKWGPLLLIEETEVLPAALEGFLLDIKPGYVEDPTRAVYNHAWVIGNTAAIGVDVQAQVDGLTELAPVQSGTGAPAIGPAPGTPEGEPGDSDTNDQTNP